MLKAVLFDLDNTLIDFMRMKRASCEAAVEAMVSAGLGMPKEQALELLFKLYGEHGIEYKEIFQRFSESALKRIDHRIIAEGIVAYRKAQIQYLKPYPQVIPTLIKLRNLGLKLGIVSDAPSTNAWIRLIEMGLPDFFDVIITLDDTGEVKPNKAPFRKAIEMLSLKPEEILFVGDWPERDIKGAKAVGMKTAFARYGRENPPSESGADFGLNNITDILEIIRKSKERIG